MNQAPIKLGPLALLLTVISICLTTLSILTFTTSGADLRLAQRYADTVRTRYALEAQGQAWLKETSDSIESGQEPEERTHVIEQDGMRLTIELSGNTVSDGRPEVTAWRMERIWEENTDIGNIWMGF